MVSSRQCSPSDDGADKEEPEMAALSITHSCIPSAAELEWATVAKMELHYSYLRGDITLEDSCGHRLEYHDVAVFDFVSVFLEYLIDPKGESWSYDFTEGEDELSVHCSPSELKITSENEQCTLVFDTDSWRTLFCHSVGQWLEQVQEARPEIMKNVHWKEIVDAYGAMCE